MLTRSSRSLVCGLMALTANAVALGGGGVTFEVIPNAASANDMSPDGRYIVGRKTATFEPYLLDTVTGVMTILPVPATDALAVSDDGTVVLGNMPDPVLGDQVAAIWTQSSGSWMSLGYLPNALSCPSRSSAHELSADGSVAVGLSWNGCNGRAFRWTAATGMVEMQVLASGGCRASVVSADGTVLGGFAQNPSGGRTPATWGASATGQLLDPPNGDALGEVRGISDSGAILLGEWNGQAVSWSGPGLIRRVIGGGSIIPGWTGTPQDVANDDGTIVGFDVLMLNRRAWIQPRGNGPLLDLKTFIESNGGTVPAGMVLQVARAISGDGTKIIGHGGTGAWRVIIDLPSPCATDLNGDTVTDVNDLLVLIGAWGTNGSSPADINGDLTVNVNDLLLLIGSWGPCPPAVGACCTGASCVQMLEADCIAASGHFAGDGVACAPTTCAGNDLCADAIDVTRNMNGGPVNGDNTAATPATFEGNDSELPAGSPSCHWNTNPVAAHSSVWYRFTAPANGMVTIGTCSSTAAPFVDSILGLYSGACGSLTQIACDEDSCASPSGYPYYSRLVATGLTPGQTYYVAVMNAGGWSGSVPGPFVLSITSP